MDNVLIRDANTSSVHVHATVNIVVNIGESVDNICFNVIELATQCILLCDYLDKHTASIRPRQSLVELADGTVVPIIGKPPSRGNDAIPPPEEQKYEQARRRTSN